MQARIDRRLKATRRHLLEHLHGAARTARAVLLDDDLRADPRGIGPGALQDNLQVVALGELARAVPINRGRGLEPVHHQIERPAVVQVHVGRAVRETRLCEPPGLRLVGEREVSVVAIRVVGDRDPRHLPDHRPGEPRHPAAQRGLYDGVSHVREVVEVVRPVIDAVGDEQVLAAVVVQVGKQGSPAPIGRVHARLIPDLTEAPVAAIELKRVTGVLRVVARLELQIVDVEALGIGGCLEDLFLLGEHVEDHQVRPAVVVEVRGVHAHRGVARVSHRGGDRLGERPVAVVVVEKVVFLKVIGDVQVGTAVAVQVARDHAETVPRGAALEAGVVAHVDKMAPVVPVETVARSRAARRRLRAGAGCPLGVGRMGQQVHIEVAVAVVIEEQGLGG